MPILEVKNLKKCFDKTDILKGISFDLEKGQTLSILGSSGSGKTTLLRCLNFLEKPDAGEIVVNGETIFDSTKPVTEAQIKSNRLHFGMVFQQFNLFPQYTAIENVVLAPKLMASADKYPEIMEMGETLLNKMGLSDRMNNYPHQLSGGQQQRVAIARALAMSPDILCFDEPTSALDPELTGEVLKVIKELAIGNTTMIIVTHEIGCAHDVSDQIIFMDDGVIADKGTPAQVIDNPSNPRTRQVLSNYHS